MKCDSCVENAKQTVQMIHSITTELVKKYPGLTNAQLIRLCDIERFSKKQFFTHYQCNTILNNNRVVNRRCAEYYPTKQKKYSHIGIPVTLKHLREQLHESINTLAKQIYVILRTYWENNDALCNSDLGRLLCVHETNNGYHKGWFTYEFTRNLCEQNCIKKCSFEIMSSRDKTHVNLDNHNNRKIYFIPICDNVRPCV